MRPRRVSVAESETVHCAGERAISGGEVSVCCQELRVGVGQLPELCLPALTALSETADQNRLSGSPVQSLFRSTARLAD